VPHDGAGKDLEFEQKKLREYGRKGDGGAKRERESKEETLGFFKNKGERD